MNDYRLIDTALHLLAKRVKPKFNFIAEWQWCASFINLEGNGYLKCLICDHTIHVNDISDETDELYHHGLYHIKDANLGAFL